MEEKMHLLGKHEHSDEALAGWQKLAEAGARRASLCRETARSVLKSKWKFIPCAGKTRPNDRPRPLDGVEIEDSVSERPLTAQLFEALFPSKR